MNTYQARQILGLGTEFDSVQLKKAYRRKAAETHPDKGGSAEEFQLVKTAYEYLLEPHDSEIAMLITHTTLFKIRKV